MFLKFLPIIFLMYIFFQVNILYKGDIHKYFSSTAVIEVIVALRDYWNIRSKKWSSWANKEVNMMTTLQISPHCLCIQNIPKLWLFFDFIKFSIGSKMALHWLIIFNQYFSFTSVIWHVNIINLVISLTLISSAIEGHNFSWNWT